MALLCRAPQFTSAFGLWTRRQHYPFPTRFALSDPPEVMTIRMSVSELFRACTEEREFSQWLPSDSGSMGRRFELVPDQQIVQMYMPTSMPINGIRMRVAPRAA